MLQPMALPQKDTFLSETLYYLSRMFCVYPLNFCMYQRQNFKLLQILRCGFTMLTLLICSVWSVYEKTQLSLILLKSFSWIIELLLELLNALSNNLLIIIVQKSSTEWNHLFKGLLHMQVTSKKRHTVYLCILSICTISRCLYEISITYSFPTASRSVYVTIANNLVTYSTMIVISVLGNQMLYLLKNQVLKIKSNMLMENEEYEKQIKKHYSDVVGFKFYRNISEVESKLIYTVYTLRALEGFSQIFGIPCLSWIAIATLRFTVTIIGFISFNITTFGVITKTYDCVILMVRF